MLIDFMQRNWYLIILGYYVIFTVRTFFFSDADMKTTIFKGGKIRLKEVVRCLAVAWTIPTIIVVVGLIGALILAGLGTSGECHPSHGWACETPPNFTFAYYLSFFKGGIAWVQLSILMVASLGGTLFVTFWTFKIVGKKCFPFISRAGKSVWERFPIRW